MNLPKTITALVALGVTLAIGLAMGARTVPDTGIVPHHGEARATYDSAMLVGSPELLFREGNSNVMEEDALPIDQALADSKLPRREDLDPPTGDFEPPTGPNSYGAEWYSATIREWWEEWEASDPTSKSGRLRLRSTLCRSIAVILNQSGSYKEKHAGMEDEFGRPWQFSINGYYYYFDDHSFPEFLELNREMDRLTRDDFNVNPGLVAEIQARYEEAQAYLNS